MIKKIKKLCLGASVLCFTHLANAQAQTIPNISGEVGIELQNEYTASSDDNSVDGYNNIFFKAEIEPTVQFNENFSLDGLFVFDGVQDVESNKHNFFDNEAAFIEGIKLNYQWDNWSVFAGKFDPVFGAVFDVDGIWSDDFAGDYEITERLGFGGHYSFSENSFGDYTIHASTFFADTTFLSSSIITKVDKTKKSDGGVSNTESFDSFAVSLDGDNIAGIEGLNYKVAYQSQAAGDADDDANRQTGYALTLGHSLPVSSRINTDVLAEFVDVNHYEGADVDAQYYTATASTTIDEAWNVTASYTHRKVDMTGTDSNDHLFQLSGEYDFGQGTAAEIGYRYSEESNEDTNIIGGLISHTFEF